MTLTAEANAAAGKIYNETLTEQLEAALTRYDHTSGKAQIPGEAAVLQEVSELLGKNANPDGNWGSDVPPLAQAVTRNYAQVATLLLDHGADVNWKDKSGRNVLHYAAEHNSPAVVEVLVTCKPELLGEADGWKLEPVETARAQGKHQVVNAMAAIARKIAPAYPIEDRLAQSPEQCRQKARSALEIRYQSGFPEPAAT